MSSTLTLVDGVYQWEGASSPLLARYTVFVFYPFDPTALALDVDGLEQVEGSTEEIDVNATGELEARAIAAAALEDGYEPGGRIVHVEERVGWYW